MTNLQRINTNRAEWFENKLCKQAPEIKITLVHDERCSDNDGEYFCLLASIEYIEFEGRTIIQKCRAHVSKRYIDNKPVSMTSEELMDTIHESIKNELSVNSIDIKCEVIWAC